jgi:hypothetical protein
MFVASFQQPNEPRERQWLHEPTFELDTSPTRVTILYAILQDTSGIACISVV